MNDNSNPTKFDLYKIALDTRNMEIGLFWQRSNYFLVLNTAAAVGFFFKTSNQYQLLIGIFGLCIAILWFGVNLGSKFWQSRWEHRLHEAEKSLGIEVNFFSAKWDVIESDVKESLEFSNHNWFRQKIDKLVLLQPSVSFLMMLLSMLFIILWLGLLIISVFCK